MHRAVSGRSRKSAASFDASSALSVSETQQPHIAKPEPWIYGVTVAIHTLRALLLVLYLQYEECLYFQ